MLSLGGGGVAIEEGAIVLVTGARGFIGRHCLDILLQAGCRVHAVARDTAGVPRPESVQWHAADLLEPGTSERLVEHVRPSHLLHLAWYAEPGKFWSSVENFRHVGASLELLRAFAVSGGRRAVVAGTCAEYDWRYGYCREDVTPLAPTTTYGTCKHALHQLAAALSRETRMSLGWGRVFWLYGPYEHPSRLVASVIGALLDGAEAACSTGEHRRPFLHVADAASAFVALLGSGVSGPVNIASDEPVRVRHLVEVIARQMQADGRVRFGALPRSADEEPVVCADTRRLQNEVGWRPRYNLETGIAETIAWWRTHRGLAVRG